uniref:Sushi domain-containing protein n=1 Tax=Hadrurus spadix TaxID=141984 RepID=A0A1W7RAD5_9SCOR
MWRLLGISLLYLVQVFAEDAQWKNHNCPAPRSPANGISFIFHDGALVRYRCHPGYVMRGRAYARCIKNKWDRRTPVCIRRNDRGMEELEFRSKTSYTEMPKSDQHYTLPEPSSTSRSLFDWEKESLTPPYGDGPNRLPVINGIWKTSERPSVHLFTIGNDNNVAKDLIREEIGIAEVRQRQLEEVQRTRAGDRTIPKYRPVENLRAPTKPRYHGSISVVVLPSEPKKQRFDITTRRPKRNKDKRQKGKNRRGKNKNRKSSEELRHKPEGRVSTKSQDRQNYWRNNRNSVHQRNSRPYQPPPFTSRPSHDQMIGDLSSSQYDDTCYETIRGRRIPMRAPQIPNAFVYKYDSRKHYSNPDTYYLIVHYNCRHGYTLHNKEANKLYCQNGQWVGETPLCEE